jgi:hypothetical protein
MGAPDAGVVTAYLTTVDKSAASKYGVDAIEAALRAETAAQARVCRVPTDPAVDYPDDLTEALCRRVAVNLAVRANPLGIQNAISELGASQVRVGGTDREVRRLEAPFRKLVMG